MLQSRRYFPLKHRELGRFGFSVMKPKTRKRIAAERREATLLVRADGKNEIRR